MSILYVHVFSIYTWPRYLGHLQVAHASCTPWPARVPAVLCIVTDVSSTVAASQGLVRIYSR